MRIKEVTEPDGKSHSLILSGAMQPYRGGLALAQVSLLVSYPASGGSRGIDDLMTVPARDLSHPEILPGTAQHVTPGPVIRAVPPGLALGEDIPVRGLACLALAFTCPVLTWHGVS